MVDMNLRYACLPKDKIKTCDYSTREELLESSLKKMQAYHSIKLPSPSQPPAIKKGAFTPIQIQIKNRGGNKKVSIIKNLEIFDIDPEEFAEALKHKCAASTSVQPAANSSGLGKMEVLVQGKKEKEINGLLKDQYGIPFVGGSLEKSSKFVVIL